MTIDFRYFRWKLRRYFLPFALIAALGSLTIFSYTSTWPETYTATARLLFESNEVEKETQFSSSATRQLELLEIIRYSLSLRETKRAIVEDLDLFAGSGTLEDRLARVDAGFEFRTIPRKDSLKMITLSFRHEDPEVAARVANAFAEHAIEKNREMRFEDTDGSLQFYREDVTAKAESLRAARIELSRFQTSNANALPERLNFLLERRARLQEKLLNTDTQAFRAPVQAMKSREIVRIETELNAARTRLSSQHPDVKRLEGELALLNKHWDMAESFKLHSIDKREVRLELSRVESWIAKIPGNTVLQEALRYEHDFAAEQHLAAKSRLFEAKLRNQVERENQGQKLTAIAMASPPETGPNQKKAVLNGIGVFLSLVLAAVAVFVFDWMDHRLRKPSDLTRRLGITPFATLPVFARIPVK